MSQGIYTGAGDSDSGAQENPLAVWLRNVPTWLDQDRFYTLIGKWHDVEKEKSYCFKNKQETNWIGIRYGWAIVTFRSRKSRNKFLDNEELHFVREKESAPYEKLKVSPWYDKPAKPKNTKHENIQTKPKPVSKKEVEVESKDSNFLSVEEFHRGASETSIQSFQGKIKSYFCNLAGQGHVGDIEIKLLNSKNILQQELVIFHSDCVWKCFRHENCFECGVRCGNDNFIPQHLKIGTEVNFTVRKLPPGLIENKKFQAKAVWLGDHHYPRFITPTSTAKLDEYLQDYLKETGQEFKSKSSTPEHELLRTNKNEDSSGQNSPSPGIIVPTRQKPLKGGLNQLNSTPDKTKTLPTVKKLPPTNFAQAVASAPLSIKDDLSSLILTPGQLDSIISEVEASINVPDYGTFNLHIKQLDLGFKPTHGISKYVNPKSNLSVTLKQSKPLPGSKPKYEIVRAHVNEDKKSFEDKFDPFLNDFKPKTKVLHPVIPANVWEQSSASDSIKNGSNGHHDNGNDLEIDLDELDEYYDELQRITDYLEKELPKVIPTIANDKSCVAKLANSILSRNDENEAAELQAFLDHQKISTRSKHVFIAEYIKFRNREDDEEEEEKETGEESKPELDLSIPTQVLPELEEYLKQFFNWLRSKEKKAESLSMKIDLYSFVLKKYKSIAREWIKTLQDKKEPHFKSFVKKNLIGEAEYNQCIEATSQYLRNHSHYIQEISILITWLETDTNSFRSSLMESERSENVDISGTLGLSLTKFEKEYYEFQLNRHGTKSNLSVIRDIQFLRYSEIKFEGLHKLHLRCCDDTQRSKSRDYNQKIQNLMFKWSNQRVLEDVNYFLYNETRGASDHDTSLSNIKRLDKFIPLLAGAICDFFVEKYEVKKVSKIELGERESTKKDGENSAQRSKEGLENSVKRKRTHDGKSVASKNFSDDEFDGFYDFMQLSIASGGVVLAPTASVESIIWSLQARNVTYSKLQEIWNSCQQLEQLSSCSWQLQISQLKINPPLGVTVPEIAGYISMYFESIKNSTNNVENSDHDEVLEEHEVVAEEDLLSFIQKNLYEQYKEEEVAQFLQELESSNIKTREAVMIKKYQEMFSSGKLFNKTCWQHNHEMFPISNQNAIISAGIWQDLNVTSDFLSMCVSNIHDNKLPYQGVLIKWAKLLESSHVFSSTVLDIFTIIRATLLSYDENVPEKEFTNIASNFCLYNVEGRVAAHLTDHIFSVQTRWSLVLCHLGVTYTRCCHDNSYPLPSDHWKQCKLDTCVPIGTKVFLHSTGIKDPKNKIICQIADIVWSQDPSSSKTDPPETGILLPGNVTYKKYVQYFAEKIVARSTPSLFSDNNYSSNNARYLELDNIYHEEIFLMNDTWPHNNIMEMRKEYVFCEMGGMTRPLLRSNWAGGLNTSDQEKERLLNETFNFFQTDLETQEMIDFIQPYVERAGLRNAMKIMNQKYPIVDEEPSHLNDTDSEKRKNIGAGVKEEDVSGATSKETPKEPVSKPLVTGGRNRQLSTDTIKDETLWMAESNLEQLWAEETERRMDDLAEVNDDSEEYIEDEDNPDKETKQLGAIGSSKPRSGRDSNTPHGDDNEDNVTTPRPETLNKSNIEERLDKFEAALCNMATWQPVASDIISGNRDLIMTLSSRVEFLETALNQLTLNLATGNVSTVTKEEVKDGKDCKKGMRTYVKIVKEGEEDDIAEVPTNSEGLLPQMTVTALFGGTSAIKYKVSSGGATWRALLLEDEVYHPPEDGWSDRVYTCAQPQKTKPGIKADSGLDGSPRSTSLEHSLTSPLTYSMPGLGGTNNLVSPFIPPHHPTLAHIWGNSGHAPGHLGTQVSPGQSIFNNIGPLSTLGAGAAGALGQLGAAGGALGQLGVGGTGGGALGQLGGANAYKTFSAPSNHYSKNS